MHIERDCVSRVNKGRLDIVRDVRARTSHPLPSFSHSQLTMYLYLSHPTLSMIVLHIYVLLFLLSKKMLPIHTDHVVQIKKTPTTQWDTKPLTGRTPPQMWCPSDILHLIYCKDNGATTQALMRHRGIDKVQRPWH